MFNIKGFTLVYKSDIGMIISDILHLYALKYSWQQADK